MVVKIGPRPHEVADVNQLRPVNTEPGSGVKFLRQLTDGC
jgi:hypothetical protein